MTQRSLFDPEPTESPEHARTAQDERNTSVRAIPQPTAQNGAGESWDDAERRRHVTLEEYIAGVK